jgi:hypothetical protein
MFISARTCLLIHCLAMNYSGFQTSCHKINFESLWKCIHNFIQWLCSSKPCDALCKKLAVHWLRTISLAGTLKDLHWRGVRFESRPRYLLSWLRLSVVSVPPGESRDGTSIRQPSILLISLIIIQYFNSVRSYVTDIVVISAANKLQSCFM